MRCFGRASRALDGNRENHLEVLMKKLSPRILIALLQAANGKPLKFTCSTITILFAGCAVVDTHQAKLDQRELRKILMDYTEDQILDNLVRAYNGHPIVHFDFARVNAGVTSKFSPTASSGRSIQDVRTHTPTHTQNTIPTPGPGAFSTVISVVGGTVETVMKPFSYGISSEHGNTIGLDVKPVLDDRSVYAAYVNFLNCDHDVTPTCDIAEQGATKPINKVAKKELQPAKATKTTTVEKWKEPWKDTPSPAPAVAGPVAEKTT